MQGELKECRMLVNWCERGGAIFFLGCENSFLAIPSQSMGELLQAKQKHKRKQDDVCMYNADCSFDGIAFTCDGIAECANLIRFATIYTWLMYRADHLLLIVWYLKFLLIRNGFR